MSHLKRRWKVLRANQFSGNVPFISIKCDLQEDSITENISKDMSSSEFYKKYHYIWRTKWYKC